MGRKRKLQKKKKKSTEIAKHGNGTNGADTEDTPASPFVGILLDQILSNHLITDEILQDCSHADVLNCSLVSKSWNSSARDFLWRQRNTLLSLRPLKTVKELEGVAVLMENNILGGNQPFRGIVLNINESKEYPFNGEEDLDEILVNRKLLQRILAKMATDHVTITQSYDFDEYDQNVLHHQTVSRVYRNYATALLVDTITSLCTKDLIIHCGEFVKPLREIIFPNLKSLDRLPGDFIDDECSEDDVKKLSAAFPALEWHRPVFFLHLHDFIKWEIAQTVKTLYIIDSHHHISDDEEVEMIETAGLHLKRLVLHLKPEKIVVSTLSRIISSSCESLEEIRINYDLLQAFQHYQGFPCLTNVRKLSCVYKEEDGDKIFQEGSNPCLQHIFPKAILKFRNIYDDTASDSDNE